MLDPQQALAAAARPVPPRARSQRRVLVLGGGGPLGSAVLERLLGGHRFERVGVVVDQRLQPALRGLTAVDDDAAAWQQFGPETAVIVFDRERHANGRDDAFVRPLPAELLALAGRLQAAGVRQLVVALPHAPSMLPQALKVGLASLDEGAVAALGFDHLVFMRMAQSGSFAAGGDDDGRSAPQRLAAWMLRQLHWMVPSGDQPVRIQTVARVVAHLALDLPDAPPGTRVLPPELLWQAAQMEDAQALVAGWLAGADVPAVRSARMRM
jgi:hypothetical protein